MDGPLVFRATYEGEHTAAVSLVPLLVSLLGLAATIGLAVPRSGEPRRHGSWAPMLVTGVVAWLGALGLFLLGVLQAIGRPTVFGAMPGLWLGCVLAGPVATIPAGIVLRHAAKARAAAALGSLLGACAGLVFAAYLAWLGPLPRLDDGLDDWAHRAPEVEIITTVLGDRAAGWELGPPQRVRADGSHVVAISRASSPLVWVERRREVPTVEDRAHPALLLRTGTRWRYAAVDSSFDGWAAGSSASESYLAMSIAAEEWARGIHRYRLDVASAAPGARHWLTGQDGETFVLVEREDDDAPGWERLPFPSSEGAPEFEFPLLGVRCGGVSRAPAAGPCACSRSDSSLFGVLLGVVTAGASAPDVVTTHSIELVESETPAGPDAPAGSPIPPTECEEWAEATALGFEIALRPRPRAASRLRRRLADLDSWAGWEIRDDVVVGCVDSPFVVAPLGSAITLRARERAGCATGCEAHFDATQLPPDITELIESAEVGARCP